MCHPQVITIKYQGSHLLLFTGLKNASRQEQSQNEMLAMRWKETHIAPNWYYNRCAAALQTFLERKYSTRFTLMCVKKSKGIMQEARST